MSGTIVVRPGVEIHYEDQCFAAPWEQAEPVLLVHGVSESGVAWLQWVPDLAAQFRVIRPDLPGFGRSPAPQAYTWKTDELAADLARLLDRLEIPRVHLVGAKYGGTVALQFAVDFPQRLMSLAVLGTPARGRGTGVEGSGKRIQEVGVYQWAAETQRRRLGSSASEAQIRWWTDELMGKADYRASLSCALYLDEADLEPRLAEIKVPVLVVTTEGSPMQAPDAARAYQQRIPNSRLVVLQGDCYHIAAVKPHECAQHVLAFLREL